MTTCVVVNPFMMGVNPRQSFQEQEEKVLNGELMDLKQVHDNLSWYRVPPRAHLTATDRSSRSALRALLQQPPPLSLVPESDTIHKDVMQPSWPPYPEQADFRSPNVGLSSDSIQPLRQCNSLQSSQHQVGDQDFDLPQRTSNHYHLDYSNRSRGRQELPVARSLPLKQVQSQLELQDQRQVLERRRITRHNMPAIPQRMGSSLPEEIEKMQMMAVAQQQLHNIRLERKRSFDQDKQLPLPEGARGSKLQFGFPADGIRNGPENHPVLHNQQRLQQQQQEVFSRGFFSPTNQPNDQDLNTTTRGSPRSAFSTETNIHVEDAEATVIKQFQGRVLKLDVGTRLNLQDSLYRLGRSARERQEETRASGRTSAEPDYPAAMMDMDLHSCSNRPASVPQSRVQVETHTNPIDRTLMNMMFSPLRLPGLQNPPEHRPPSCTRSRPVAAGISQGNRGWSTSTRSKSNNWGTSVDPADAGNIVDAQFHGGDGCEAAALEALTSRTVTSLATWTHAPQLTDYSSPTGSSSPVDPSMLDHRQADISLTYRGSVGTVAQTARALGGNRSTTTQPVDIRAPRRSDSQSSITSDHSYSSSHGGQILQHFGNVGFYGPSSYSSQEAGSFVSDGQHMELAAGSHGVDQHPTNQNFAMMTMNADILGAARSIESGTAVDHIDRFHPPLPSSASHNSNAKNVTLGFSPLRYDDGSYFESESRRRNLGNTSTSTGMSIFDHGSTSVMRNIMVDTVAYTQSSELIPSSVSSSTANISLTSE